MTMTDCQIYAVDYDDALIVVVEGELDLTTAPVLDARLRAAELVETRTVVVDLERVTFLDSSGLHVLIEHSRPERHGSRLRLTRGSRQVRRVFELVGMTQRLPFVSGA